MALALEEAAADGKKRHLNLAEETIENGMKHFGKKGDPAQIPHYYQFYYLKGVLSEVRNESLENQLAHFLLAYHIRPDDYSVNRKIAAVYYQAAIVSKDDQEKKALAETSFAFFKQYLAYLENDPKFHRENLIVLEREYLRHFPFLEKEITAARTDILHKLNYKRGLF
jgi:hypothetical protein